MRTKACLLHGLQAESKGALTRNQVPFTEHLLCSHQGGPLCKSHLELGWIHMWDSLTQGPHFTLCLLGAKDSRPCLGVQE